MGDSTSVPLESRQLVRKGRSAPKDVTDVVTVLKELSKLLQSCTTDGCPKDPELAHKEGELKKDGQLMKESLVEHI